jgi:hypothetical protein
MANEVTVRASLQIKKALTTANDLDYQSKPTTFKANMTGRKGPVPGAFTAEYPGGTDVDLSELTTPGWCWIQNLDTTNFVTVGIYDPESSKFYPMVEIHAGEFCPPFRVSRDIGWEYGTGTGTGGPETNKLRVRPDTADCNVRVDTFEI